LLQEIFLHQPLFLLHNTRNQPHLISNFVQKEQKKLLWATKSRLKQVVLLAREQKPPQSHAPGGFFARCCA